VPFTQTFFTRSGFDLDLIWGFFVSSKRPLVLCRLVFRWKRSAAGFLYSREGTGLEKALFFRIGTYMEVQGCSKTNMKTEVLTILRKKFRYSYCFSFNTTLFWKIVFTYVSPIFIPASFIHCPWNVV
jgi:hypothetical protein